jgi:hypothetical protein
MDLGSITSRDRDFPLRYGVPTGCGETESSRTLKKCTLTLPIPSPVLQYPQVNMGLKCDMSLNFTACCNTAHSKTGDILFLSVCLSAYLPSVLKFSFLLSTFLLCMTSRKQCMVLFHETIYICGVCVCIHT